MNPLMKLICLALVGSALAHTTSGFATTVRSVKHCIEVEETTPEKCTKICRAQSSIKDWSLYPLRVALDGNKQCCCMFDDLWGINESERWYDDDYPEMSFMNKLFVEPKECSSILITRADKEEKKAYNKMCEYLRKKRPLTMLELSEFIGSVRYLRSIQPKSGSVREKLTQDYVPHFSPEMQNVFEQSLGSLLDHKRDSNKPEAPFEVERIEKLTELTTNLRKSLDIDMVHRAFDELIISQVMISVLGARKFYTAINQKIPGDCFESLRGNNGSELPLDPRTMEITDFSCEKFKAASDLLTHLMNSISTAFESMKTEGTFDAMRFYWYPFYMLSRSITVYNELIKWRCTTGADKPAEIEFRAPEQ